MRAAIVIIAMLAAGSARAGESPTHFTISQRASYAVRLTTAPLSTRVHTRHDRPHFLGVIAEAERFLGSGNPTSLRAAWCAAFISLVLRRTGHRPLPNNMSSSALSYGPRLSAPAVGSLIVLPRHVGLVAGVEGDRVTMISGNWGRRVAIAQLSRRAAIAFVAIPN